MMDSRDRLFYLVKLAGHGAAKREDFYPYVEQLIKDSKAAVASDTDPCPDSGLDLLLTAWDGGFLTDEQKAEIKAIIVGKPEKPETTEPKNG